jgi:hypothetical protein
MNGSQPLGPPGDQRTSGEMPIMNRRALASATQ